MGQHAVVLRLELCQQVRLDVLNLADLYLCDRLLELGQDVAVRGRAADLLIFIEDVLEVSSNSYLDVRRDLNEMLAIDDASKLVVEVLVCALDHAALHSIELLRVERHSLAGAVLRNLVLNRFK